MLFVGVPFILLQLALTLSLSLGKAGLLENVMGFARVEEQVLGVLHDNLRLSNLAQGF